MQAKRTSRGRLGWALAFCLCISPTAPADEKLRSAGPEMATLWPPMTTFVLKVDGVKPPKYPLLWKAITPGEHVIEVRFHTDVPGGVLMRSRAIRATFAKGHTYCWQNDLVTGELFFNDLGYGAEIPKTRFVGWSKEYRQGVLDARKMPVHDVTIMPSTEW